MKINIFLLATLTLATGDRLAGLVNSRVKDAQCNLVCGHLESDTDYAKCRRLCSEHDETKQHLCRLPTCDLACQTACVHNQVQQQILDFSLDGCTLDWTMTTADTKSILVGEDVWGRYTVLYQGTGNDQYDISPENSGTWRQFVLLAVGQAGLEARETLKLEKPLQCSQPSLPEALFILDNPNWVLIGSALALVLIAVMVFILILRLTRCSSAKRSDSPAPTLPTISSLCESKTVFKTNTCHSFEDYKIYEDFSFNNFAVASLQKSHINSFV